MSDERASWRPNRFETGLWGCEVSFRFPTVKLLDYEQQFRTELEQWEREGRMPYLSTIERMALQKGLEQGRKEGREQGERALILRLLTRRFGEVSTQRQARIAALTLPQLEVLGEVLLDFQTGADLDLWLDECDS
ncbi:DUF4351 domain-containing protein [Synechococcus sp. PCC 7336]|uniref:DUF4351 domain-containing protein n=1 Tax=Synechococcus sp. PCC 7336 TaxID=195250 RepID=UPI001D0CEED3|nr:DUF4351 domain-containing protein [Synechococcus sp. PCC 7336]